MIHIGPHFSRCLLAAVMALAVLAGAGVLLYRHYSASSTTAQPELQRVLDGLVTGRHKAAFGATAYVIGPHGTWLGAAGIADRATNEPMKADARMRLESVSKVYTATLIEQLAQDKKLKLSDTIAKWLPGVLPYGDRITLRQVMTMHSGLVDNNDFLHDPAKYLAYVKDAKLRAKLLSLGKQLDKHPDMTVSFMWWVRWAAWVPLLSKPGTTNHYSNIGYDLLGMVAARAGGKPFPELYQERIFTPLHLDQTAYDPQGPIHGTHARGYSILPNGKATDQTNMHPGISAEGGIVSNAKDTAAFLIGLMSGKLVESHHLYALKLDDLWLGGWDSGCAGSTYGWSGGGTGYKTDVWINGDGTRAVVLLLNSRLQTAHGDDRTLAAAQKLYCTA
jgi:D-alanyl-D-alanine carboxypeptidase